MRPTRRPVAMTPLCLLLVIGTSAFAEDWPRFRGPTGDGHAPGANPLLEWSGDDGLLWRTPLPGPGSSSPIVVGNRVFLTSYGGYGLNVDDPGNSENLDRHALCLDLTTGKVLWDHAVPGLESETKFAGPYITMHGYASSTPVSDGEHVYFFLGSAGVLAYTLDGELAWRADVGNRSHAWGSGASPVLFDDLLIVNASMESDSLIALHKRNGVGVWTVSGIPRAWNTPLLVEFDDKPTEVVLSVQGKVLGLDVRTGDELWTCSGIKAAELCPSPVEHDGVVYVLGHPQGMAMAVRAGGRGDVTESHVLWRLNKGSNVGSPLYHDGHLYFANDKRGVAYCVRAESGEIVYEQRLAPNPGMIYASPILASGRLYYTSRRGDTLVVAAEPEYRLLAHNPLPADPGPFNASPTPIAGKLLLRSDRFLYCLGDE